MSPCPESLPGRWLHAWDSSLQTALSRFDFFFFFSLKHFPPPDSGKGNIFQSRNKLLLIALPCEYTVGGLCRCENAPLIDVH